MSNVTEADYLALCEKVQADAGRVASMCLAASNKSSGLSKFMIDNAGKEALALADFAADARMRVVMANEAADESRFDLAGLAALPMNGPEFDE